ncbi:hypothetical protein AVEN_54552-1 [Araneus ventricosus]|uniref:Uncharacterized protein n=1 Tax=Araneus ventricosus TaxID=182803 RepID=A0A4Y2BMF7_ARAVE|nr:hypothetical protein AVEN_54552-1 [Araneus ventricosus]
MCIKLRNIIFLSNSSNASSSVRRKKTESTCSVNSLVACDDSSNTQVKRDALMFAPTISPLDYVFANSKVFSDLSSVEHLRMRMESKKCYYTDRQTDSPIDGFGPKFNRLNSLDDRNNA